jgi:hypothetical protein
MRSMAVAVPLAMVVGGCAGATDETDRGTTEVAEQRHPDVLEDTLEPAGDAFGCRFPGADRGVGSGG